METIRGEAAYKALKEKALMYPTPEDGYEYINVKIAFSVVDAKGDFSIEPNQFDFKAFSENNEESPTNAYASINPILSGSLYAGGNAEGWITLKVKKDDDSPKLAFGLDYNGSGGIWFKLYN